MMTLYQGIMAAAPSTYLSTELITIPLLGTDTFDGILNLLLVCLWLNYSSWNNCTDHFF